MVKIIFTQGLATRKIFVDDLIAGYINKEKDGTWSAVIFQEGPKKLGVDSRVPLVVKDGDRILPRRKSLETLREEIRKIF